MDLLITNLPNDIFYVITKYLDYTSYIYLRFCCKDFYKFNFLLTFNKKANIINRFFLNKFYSPFSDLKLLNRNGYLVNLENLLKNPKRYDGILVQCISWFQYNFQYIEAGNVIEGLIFKHKQTNAWIIQDIETNKIHPFLNPFIFPKSIRIIK